LKWDDKVYEHPTFIQVVRLYRSECDLSFEEAKDRAAMEFAKRGWEIPRPFGGKS